MAAFLFLRGLRGLSSRSGRARRRRAPSISGVVLFWAAFVLTRPFGATFGDLLTKTPAKGGLGFGTIGSSMVLLSILLSLVYWTRRHHLDVAPDALPAEVRTTTC